jgi:SAM-dependent methyltransferase
MPASGTPRFRVETACRVCGGTSLHTLLELGEVPLANALLRQEDLDRPEPRFPLTLLFCAECTLVQIRETVDPELLFGHYLYFSSYSDTMLAHARDEADTLIRRLGLGRDSLVLEIASNDGYLLRNFVERGIPVLGCEPARNVAEVAVARGVPTLCAFFGRELGQRLRHQGKLAHAVLGNNVLAHVADLDGVAAGIAAALAPEGRAVLEFPYVGAMIEGTEFDTIYHEHLAYFSLHAVEALFSRHGLRLVDVERLSIHGGSLRVWLAHASDGADPDPAVERLRGEERASGMTTLAYYRRFAEQVGHLRADLLHDLGRRRGAGQRLAAYGASAKGSTLMNVLGIGAETLEFVADRSPVKQGRFTPGNRLPIVDPSALLSRRPDAVLLLTWNFAEEILRQQSAYLRGGGTFIVPVPQVRAIGGVA